MEVVIIGIAIEDALLNSLKRQEVLSSETGELPYSEMTHVAFGVNENYAMSAGVAMTSLILHNPDRQFYFHLFIDSLRDQDHQRLIQLAKQYKTVVAIYYLKPEAFAALPTNGHITQGTYYRFIIPLVLKEITQRVLYLDSDIICMSGIDELLQLDLSNYVGAVVSDVDSMVAKRVPKLQLKKGKYFNAGFLYINIPEWNKQQISTQALQALSATAFLDQDALNIVLDGKVQFLEEKWNYLYDVTYMTAELRFPIAFLHYVGRVKPWKVFCRHEVRKYYLKVAEQSFWAEVAIEDPSTYREAKIYGRLLVREGDWLNGLRWMVKYSWWKMKR